MGVDAVFYTPYRIGEVPQVSGVYAWYCRFSLSDHDIKECVKALSGCTNKNDKRDIVRQFLDNRIFKRFRETDYHVEIKGALKPKYSGEISHLPSISSNMIDRIADNPNTLHALSDIFRTATPEFASPIYIGSAKNLRTRLTNHVKLMKQFREAGSKNSEYEPGFEGIVEQAEISDTDHSFAREAIILRKLDPSDLIVYVLPADLSDDAVIPLENILNRINYPLCGRN